MNKASIGRELSGSFRLHCVVTGLLGACVFGEVVTFIAMGVNLLHLALTKVVGTAEYVNLTASILGFLAFLSAIFILDFVSSINMGKIKKSWMTLYYGTNWKTPAGEIGTVADVSLSADTLEIEFSDGAKHRFPLAYLTPVNKDGPEADYSDLKKDYRIDWRFYINPFHGAIFTLFLVGVNALLLWSLMHYDLPHWLDYAFAICVILFGILFPVLLLLSSVSSEISSSDWKYSVLTSKTEWKSIDGRIGRVRWATRREVADGRYEEKLTLGFPYGTEDEFLRQDLKPMSFETMNPASTSSITS